MAGESLIRQNTLLVEDSKRIRADEERASQSFAAETTVRTYVLHYVMLK